MIRKSLIIITLFFISIQIFPQISSDKLIRKGVSLHDKGKYREAISYYEQALASNPNSMSATYEMSLSYLYLKDYNNALKYSTKVINANFQPLLIDAYCVKSSALADLNKVEDAIKLLNQAVDRCGDEYLLHYNLGLSYFKINNLKMAIAHLRKAIEIDTTHASAFLLYAYALNDSDKWIQSFLSFHFFLLLEPNTDRSRDAFSEMMDILMADLPANSPKLLPEDGIDQKKLYEFIVNNRPKDDNLEAQFIFFQEMTKKTVLVLNQMQDESKRGLLWDFFVPIYSEILASGYIDTYCRYISVSYFPKSLDWWNKNTAEVDKFITWFEDGQGEGNSLEEEYGDDSEE